MPGSTAAAPRVDERDSELLKVTGVACSESCFSRRGNTGDLGVADLQRSIGALSLGRDARGSEGGRRVEGLNSALQLVGAESSPKARSSCCRRRLGLSNSKAVRTSNTVIEVVQIDSAG